MNTRSIVPSVAGVVGLAVAGCFGLSSSSTAQSFEVFGEQAGDRFGSVVCTVADLTGDGISEILVGAPEADYGASASGSIYLLSGADGSTIRRHDGQGAGRQFGHLVAAVGDVDLDGVEDYAAAAKRDNSLRYPSGLVRVFSGVDGTELYEFRSFRTWDRFGWALSGAGDVNQDGHADLLIGAPDDDFGGIGSGSAFVYSGADGSLLHTYRGQKAWDRLGSAVAALGDVDGDGASDFAVGIPLRENGFREAGAVDVYSGATGALILRAPGRERDAFFGSEVVAMGDVTGDGIPDFAASGVRDRDNILGYEGYVQIISAADGEAIATWENDALGEGFGRNLAAADVTGDGYRDLIVGAPLASFFGGAGLGAGAMRMFSGPSGRYLSQTLGDGTDYGLGHCATGLGLDLDGDGMNEIIVGEPGANQSAGKLRSLSGPPLTPLSIENAVAGQTATIRIEGGIPFSSYRVEASLDGPGNANPFGSPGLDLADPLLFLGTLTVNAAGNGSLNVAVPGDASGVEVWMQAWVPSPSAIAASRMVRFSIQ